MLRVACRPPGRWLQSTGGPWSAVLHKSFAVVS